jgi:hypothetical protein
MTLTEAARELSDPCIFFVVPDHKTRTRTLETAARLLERDSIRTKPEEIDVLMIQLRRFM